jgi:hypothetical protein
MKLDFDLRRIADIPDPFEHVADLPVPPRPDSAPALPRSRFHVTGTRAIALVGALVYEGIWLEIFSKRGDLAAIPRATLLAEVAIPLVAGALALKAAAAPGERGLGEAKGRLAAWVLISPALFVLATLFAGPADVDGELFWPHALRCFLITALLGLGPLVLAAWAYRRAFVAAPAWRAAALGIACAATGAASMSLLCSVGSPAHVLVAHGGMILVAGVTGALVGRRLCEA